MTGLPRQPKNRQNKHTNVKESSVFPTVAWLCKLGLLYTMVTKRRLQAPKVEIFLGGTVPLELRGNQQSEATARRGQSR